MRPTPFPPVVLLGERIKLRLIEERDAPQLFALYSDREVMRYWNHAAWTTLDQARQASEEAHSEYASGASMHYVIEHLSSKDIIGSCALYSIDQKARCAAVGYLLAKVYWGQGYLSEAMCSLLNYGFTELQLDSIHAEVNPNNTPSAKALNKLGFEYDGCALASWIVDGKKYDTESYRIHRHHWLNRKMQIR